MFASMVTTNNLSLVLVLVNILARIVFFLTGWNYISASEEWVSTFGIVIDLSDIALIWVMRQLCSKKTTPYRIIFYTLITFKLTEFLLFISKEDLVTFIYDLTQVAPIVTIVATGLVYIVFFIALLGTNYRLYATVSLIYHVFFMLRYFYFIYIDVVPNDSDIVAVFVNCIMMGVLFMCLYKKTGLPKPEEVLHE